jgi:hypothetical protein
MWRSNPIFIGAHFWLAPNGAAFTSPGAGTISQNGATWPDAGEPNWTNWALGVCESFDIDPKYASGEDILTPSPGTLTPTDHIIPFSQPEIAFTLAFADALAVQLALNTLAIFPTGPTVATPFGGGAPGVRGILKAQKYDQNNNLILNLTVWAFVMLKTALKGSGKAMTKPEYTAKILGAANNIGSV